MHTYRPTKAGISLLALALVLTSCSTFQSESPVRLDAGGPDMGERWNATLTSPRQVAGVVDISGSAWMHPMDIRDATEVSIQIRNASPGGVHPWEVRRGRCGASEGPLGAADDYEPLEVGDEGTASATTTLATIPPESQSYFVAVYASPNNRDLTIACGNLAPPSN